jgi:hypothetical protein
MKQAKKKPNTQFLGQNAKSNINMPLSNENFEKHKKTSFVLLKKTVK